MLSKEVCQACMASRSEVELSYSECEALWQQSYIYDPKPKAHWRSWCHVDEVDWGKGSVNCRILSPNFKEQSAKVESTPPYWCPLSLEHVVSTNE